MSDNPLPARKQPMVVFSFKDGQVTNLSLKPISELNLPKSTPDAEPFDIDLRDLSFEMTITTPITYHYSRMEIDTLGQLVLYADAFVFGYKIIVSGRYKPMLLSTIDRNGIYLHPPLTLEHQLMMDALVNELVKVAVWSNEIQVHKG